MLNSKILVQFSTNTNWKDSVINKIRLASGSNLSPLEAEGLFVRIAHLLNDSENHHQSVLIPPIVESNVTMTDDKIKAVYITIVSTIVSRMPMEDEAIEKLAERLLNNVVIERSTSVSKGLEAITFEVMRKSSDKLLFDEAAAICNRWLGKTNTASDDEITREIILLSNKKLTFSEAVTILEYIKIQDVNEQDLINAELDRLLDSEDDDDFFEGILNMQKSVSKGGLDTNRIPGGLGEFGHDKRNPIPVNSIPAIKVYLSQLVTAKGEPVNWHRIGSFRVDNIANPVDAYRIHTRDGIEIAVLYFSAYHKKMSQTAPRGFQLLIN